MKMSAYRLGLLGLGVFALSGCAGLASGGPADPQLAAPPAGGDVIGRVEVHEVGKEGTLIELARAKALGYIELAAANPGVDPWLPGARTKVILPTAHVLPPGPREGLVINLAEQRLYFFDGAGEPVTYPIGVGRDGLDTPLGVTKVVRKREGPTWSPTASARKEDPKLPAVVPPGPENPLGTHAMYLGRPAYLVHGTNEPYGIGRRVSRGCIRLYPEDNTALYEVVPKGARVTVMDEPLKLGAAGGELYLEAHPSLRRAGQIEDSGRFEQEAVPTIKERILAAAAGSAIRLDWDAVEVALQKRQGIPVQITRSAESQQADLSADVGDFFDLMIGEVFGDETVDN